ncbi:hypothetical protein [Nonomuraea fuscirosea]|uniref:hypothetical protein n=1 Tax=Nonomuraea fuscirosea TaxID=1291556 RepID=UPI00343061F0
MPSPRSRTLSSATRVPVKLTVAVAPAWPLQWSSLQKHWSPQPGPDRHEPA